MDLARLILDYLKALIWPILILVILLFFTGDIKTLFQRTESADAGILKFKFSGGQTGNATNKEDKKAPDLFFNFHKTDNSKFDCQYRAKLALKNNGFLVNGGEVGMNGTLFYGYSQEYVGVVACGESLNDALIAVSGINAEGAAERRSKLSRSFEDAGR